MMTITKLPITCSERSPITTRNKLGNMGDAVVKKQREGCADWSAQVSPGKILGCFSGTEHSWASSTS